MKLSHQRLLRLPFLLYLLLQLATNSITCTTASILQPTFFEGNCSGYPMQIVDFLDYWDANGPTAISFFQSGGGYDGRRDNKSSVLVKVHSLPDRKSRNLWLHLTCPQETEQRISLPTDATLCCSSRPIFVVMDPSRHIANSYVVGIGIRGPSKLTLERVFKDRIKVQLEVEHETGSSYSNELYIYDLETLAGGRRGDLKSVQEPAFLSKDFINMIRNSESMAEDLGSVQFISRRVMPVWKKAPRLFRRMLKFGAHIGQKSKFGVCDVGNKAIGFGCSMNLHSKEMPNTDSIIYQYIDHNSGVLYYSTNGIRRAARNLDASKQLYFCAFVSTSCGNPKAPLRLLVNDYTPSQLKSLTDKPVDNLLNCTMANYTRNYPIKDEVLTRYLTGKPDFIELPFVCTTESYKPRAVIESYDLFEPDKHSDSKSMYSSPVLIKERKIMRMSAGNEVDCDANHQTVIEMIRITTLHKPAYGYVDYRSEFKCFSLPRFNSKSSLPARVFALQGDSITFNCSVSFRQVNPSSVKLTPEIYSNITKSGSTKWRNISLHEFNSIVGDTVLTVSESETNQSKTLTFKLAVPKNADVGKRLTHSLSCVSTTTGSDAEDMGMPEVKVRSSTDVVFVPQPPSSNASVQSRPDWHQQLGRENVDFNVTLMPLDMRKYLRDVGVDVNMEVKADGKSLTCLESDSVQLSSDTNGAVMVRVLPKLNENRLKRWGKLELVTRYHYPLGLIGSERIKSVGSNFQGQDRNSSCSSDSRCFLTTRCVLADVKNG